METVKKSLCNLYSNNTKHEKSEIHQTEAILYIFFFPRESEAELC